MVVALLPDTIISHYGISNVVGPFSGGLNNSGEAIRIDNAAGLAVDNLTFDDAAPWPLTPDGSGPSLSLLDPNLDNSLGASWAASSQNGGTPGKVNFPPLPTLTVVYPNGGESFLQGATVNISWTSTVFTGGIKIELVETTTNTAVVLFASVPVSDGNINWLVSEAARSDYKIKISDAVDGDPMDESNAVFSVNLPKIVITEIMYNVPEAGTGSFEFIELYNNDVAVVNLQNWYFSQGVDFVFPNVNIAPGARLVIAQNAATILNTFGINALQWTSGNLDDAGEVIELRNQFTTVCDYVSYDDVAPWPVSADGYGPSLTLCDASSDNSLAGNWSASIELAAVISGGVDVYATAGAGCSGDIAQSIVIPTGWSGVSSYIIPANPAIVTMFAPIVNSVVVVQDFSHLYMPSYGINTIGNWDTKTAYQTKLNANKYFVIKGAYETSNTVDLTLGWNSLPVISTCPVSVAGLFGAVPQVIFIKELGSSLVYWPGGSLTTLTTLEPGKAYLIKVSAPITVTFPACSAKDDFTIQKPENKISSIWNEVTPTGASHAIGFTSSALTDLDAGDIIGAFNANGQCAGITEVGEGNALIMTWADDVYTFETDGFTEEEGFSYKVYRPSTAEVFDVTAIYDNSAPNTGSFATNGISLVKELKIGATGIGTQNTRVRIYPNPANSVVNIDLMQQYTNVEVYSMVGSLLYSANVSGNFIKLDVSNFEQGVYFLKLINQNSGDQTTTRFIKE